MKTVIINCLKNRFIRDDCVFLYSLDTDERLDEVLTKLFHTYGYDDNSFSVEVETCFVNSSYMCGYCAIAWTFQNRIHTYNFQWEVM